MNYNLLYTEISRDAYAGMSDAEIVTALNAETTARRRVPISELQARAMETGVYTALRAAVASTQVPDDLRAVCQTVLDLAQARFADVDLDNAASVQMFGAIQQAGIMTAQQAAAIDALADAGTTSRALELGLGAVTVDDLALARRLPEIDALRVRLASGYNAAVLLLDAAQDGGDVPLWANLVATVEAAA